MVKKLYEPQTCSGVNVVVVNSEHKSASSGNKLILLSEQLRTQRPITLHWLDYKIKYIQYKYLKIKYINSFKFKVLSFKF